MEGFQKIVLIAAIIILIICLIFIGVSLSQQTAKQQWPPLVPACPDYWTIDGSSNPVCKNKKHLGTSTTPYTISLTDPNFSSTCNKFTWANNNNLTWDGITYGVSNPCSTT